MYRTYSKILNHRIYISGTDGTLKETIDQFGIKGDRYVRTVLLIFHFSGMEGIGIAEDNIALFQMEGAVVYTIMHGAFFYISNLDFRMAVPHKRIGIVFRQTLITDQKGKVIASMFFSSF